MTPVVGIAGWKNSGKTTLVVKLIGELKQRGYRVASIKHAHHGTDIDRKETDSYRHRAAGASEVALVTLDRWAIIHELADEPPAELNEILARLSPADIVIVEGFKWEPIPKIEVRRLGSSKQDPIAPEDDTIIAIASDAPGKAAGLPHFSSDDVVAIADFVVDRFGLGKMARI